MLIIRLQRVGRKNQPVFRIVLAEKQRAVKKQVVEILGHYNPRSKEFGLKSEERLKYWLSQQIEVSPTVHNLLVTKGLISGEKVKAWKPKKAKPSPAGEVPAKAGNQSLKDTDKGGPQTKEEKPAEAPKAPESGEAKSAEAETAEHEEPQVEKPAAEMSKDKTPSPNDQ